MWDRLDQLLAQLLQEEANLVRKSREPMKAPLKSPVTGSRVDSARMMKGGGKRGHKEDAEQMRVPREQTRLCAKTGMEDGDPGREVTKEMTTR